MNGLSLGDMNVYGDYPAKMVKGLATIAACLHSAYDALPDTTSSLADKCLFASLTCRDFLTDIGYRDATVRMCAVVIDGHRNGAPIKSLGIGMPADNRIIEGKFNGHAAVEVPSLQLLIDPTLGQAKRERFNGALPGMLALPIVAVEPPIAYEGLNLITGMEAHEAANDDAWLRIAYFDRPDLNFRKQLDYLDPRSRERRRAVARALSAAFYPFEEAS